MHIVQSVQDCPQATQAAAVAALQLEWPDVQAFQGSTAAVLAELKQRYLDTLVLLDETDGFCALACIGLHALGESPAASSVGGEFWISNVLVAPDKRRRGLGTRIVRSAERCLKSRGATVANLWCVDSLVPFYEREGWIQVGPFNGRQSATALVRFV